LSPFVRAQVVLRADRTLAGAVFCLLFAVYLATFSGLPENPDSEVEFQSTSALVRRQSLALGGTSESEAIVGIVHQGRQGFNVRRGGPGREHETFSWSGVGQPLVAFPLYLVGTLAARLFPALEQRHAGSTHLGVGRSEYFEHLFVGLRNPLLGALTGALLVLASRRAGARRKHAVVCGASYGLCTYAWPQARGTLSDVQATAALFLAFVLTQAALERLERAKRPHLAVLLGFGLALGLAFATRPVLAPAVVVLVAFFALRVIGAARSLARPFPLRELAAAFLPALACLAGVLWVNHARFGDPLELGYGGVVGLDWFLRAPWEGLLGATVSPGSGLLWFAPGLLLAVPWSVHALRHGDRAAVLFVLALVAALGLPHVLIPSWHGAWSYGPRYLLPLLPFLWFPLGVTLGLVWERALGRAVVVLLLVLGFASALGGVLVEYNTNLDLSLQAARIAWPSPPALDEVQERELDDARFVRTKFDLRFAAPWAHWRIFRHRVAGLGERYAVSELYYLPSAAVIEPQWEREQGFGHLAWVDLRRRLGGPAWPGPVLVGAVLLLAGVLLLRAQDPGRP
jgi:heme/copper-type cytochrome/quinol oxidase subunit 3